MVSVLLIRVRLRVLLFWVIVYEPIGKISAGIGKMDLNPVPFEMLDEWEFNFS